MFSWYQYLTVDLVFSSSHFSYWSGNLFLIASIPDLCLLYLLPFRPLYSNISLLSFLLFLRDSHFSDLKCQSCSQFQKHNFQSQTLPQDFEPFPVLPAGRECEGLKLSFHIPRPVAPVLYKLLLSHLGDKNTNFSSRILEFC